jgi:hypothetical protein
MNIQLIPCSSSGVLQFSAKFSGNDQSVGPDVSTVKWMLLNSNIVT